MNHEYATGQYWNPTATEQFTHLTVHVVTTAGKLIPDPDEPVSGTSYVEV